MLYLALDGLRDRRLVDPHDEHRVHLLELLSATHCSMVAVYATRSQPLKHSLVEDELSMIDPTIDSDFRRTMLSVE
jgi:hypothetical protein